MSLSIAAATDRITQLLTDANTASSTKVDVFVGEPAPKTDGDGKAHPYHAIFPSPGLRDARDARLDGAHGARLWRVQIKCAGGDVARALRALERAQNVLVGACLDDTTGLIREDGDGGPVRKDDTVSPARWFTDLLLAVEL